MHIQISPWYPGSKFPIPGGKGKMSKTKSLISSVVKSLENEIDMLKDSTTQEITEINCYLSRNRAQIKLRPRIVPNKGHSTFSIIWQKLIFYDFANRRAKFAQVRKGPSSQVPRSRLLLRCRNCDAWEREYIWEKEVQFSQVRKKVAILSRGISALKQYRILEDVDDPEDAPVTAAGNLEMQELLEILTEVSNNLLECAFRKIDAVSARLEGGKTDLRPSIKLFRSRSGQFSVEWCKPHGINPTTGLSIERPIPREGKFTIRRSRLLAHCRDCDDWGKEFVWETEVEFVRVRKQSALLNQAITALRQYVRETN
jgi:MobI protein